MHASCTIHDDLGGHEGVMGLRWRYQSTASLDRKTQVGDTPNTRRGRASQKPELEHPLVVVFQKLDTAGSTRQA